MQKIDGFLAVLNITGGKFSPHPQKLPFSVTSVDGDNYLLYYSSIDLSVHSSSNKCEGPTLKRSLSANGSSDDKARLKIPMKGRLQLVFSLSAYYHFVFLIFLLTMCFKPSRCTDNFSPDVFFTLIIFSAKYFTAVTSLIWWELWKTVDCLKKDNFPS